MKNAPQILVVDDEQDIRSLLDMVLSEKYSVSTAEDASVAMKSFVQTTPHVIISDIRMPNGDGFSLLKSIQEKHPGLPVILITGHGNDDIEEEAFMKGAFDYLTKPFDNSELLKSIERALNTINYYRKHPTKVN